MNTAHLATQIQRARAVLFTGAGFSLGARNVSGDPVPSAGQLKEMLWQLCFPDSPFAPTTDLQLVYEAALGRHKRALGDLLKAYFSVDADSLPEWYCLFFRMPWKKCYTLNIDNLALAAGLHFDLPRSISAVSAMRAKSHVRHDSEDETLRVVHLNGDLQDVPDGVTFARTQYADRIASQDPIYLELAAELLTHPFVFIGTTLEEPPLWQHILLRFQRGSRTREFRPRSYLVTPTLDQAQQSALSGYNIEWVPMTSEQFATEVLSKFGSQAKEGLALLGSHTSAHTTPNRIPEVLDLAVSPRERTEFLLGSEPRWSDIQSGRAIERDHDKQISTNLSNALKSDERAIFLLTGNAGSGKSASLMRGALALAANGARVGWIDRDSPFSPRSLRSCVAKTCISHRGGRQSRSRHPKPAPRSWFFGIRAIVSMSSRFFDEKLEYLRIRYVDIESGTIIGQMIDRKDQPVTSVRDRACEPLP